MLDTKFIINKEKRSWIDCNKEEVYVETCKIQELIQECFGNVYNTTIRLFAENVLENRIEEQMCPTGPQVKRKEIDDVRLEYFEKENTKETRFGYSVDYGFLDAVKCYQKKCKNIYIGRVGCNVH